VTSSHSVNSHAQSQEFESKHKYLEDIHMKASETRIKALVDEGIEVMKEIKSQGSEKRQIASHKNKTSSLQCYFDILLMRTVLMIIFWIVVCWIILVYYHFDYLQNSLFLDILVIFSFLAYCDSFLLRHKLIYLF